MSLPTEVPASSVAGAPRLVSLMLEFELARLPTMQRGGVVFEKHKIAYETKRSFSPAERQKAISYQLAMKQRFNPHVQKIGEGGMESTAFTLVELLVVIAIIVLLASLVLPALSRAKLVRESAVCKGNLRQWGMGLNMYVDDFQVYPPCEMNDSGQAGFLRSRWWHARLVRYTGAKWQFYSWPAHPWGPPMPKGIDVCPSYARLRGLMNAHNAGSYGYNWTGVVGRKGALGLGGVILQDRAQDILPDNLRLIRENEVVHASDMIAIGDALIEAPADWTEWKIHGSAELDLSGFGMQEICIELQIGQWRQFAQGFDGMFARGASWIRRRHGGRWNVVFCDGHVESLKTRDMFDTRLDGVLKRWNRDNLPHGELVPKPFR